MIELLSPGDNFIDFDDLLTLVVGESFVPRSKTTNSKMCIIKLGDINHFDKNHWYEYAMQRDSEVMVVVVRLMIEENLMEKNPDEIVTMLLRCYSKQQQQQKNTQQDLTKVEIVEKKHDEENQHQVEIKSKW